MLDHGTGTAIDAARQHRQAAHGGQDALVRILKSHCTATVVHSALWEHTAWTSSLAEREQTRVFLHEKQRTFPTLDLKLTERELACPARMISR